MRTKKIPKLLLQLLEGKRRALPPHYPELFTPYRDMGFAGLSQLFFHNLEH